MLIFYHLKKNKGAKVLPMKNLDVHNIVGKVFLNSLELCVWIHDNTPTYIYNQHQHQPKWHMAFFFIINRKCFKKNEFISILDMIDMNMIDRYDIYDR